MSKTVVENLKPTFKVGDIIRGISDDRYLVTNTDMTKAEVTLVHSDGSIALKILEHSDPDYVGVGYGVPFRHDLKAQYFALAENPQYTFTTDMKTYVEVIIDNEKAKYECHSEKFDLQAGINAALSLFSAENVPQYVIITVDNTFGGLEKGDIVKVLSGSRSPDHLYVAAKEKGPFAGNDATNPENLEGQCFTYLNGDDYKPFNGNIYS